MMFLIILIALIAINGCALCVIVSKWEDFKGEQKENLNTFKEKIFEHVRVQIQEALIEHEALKRDFETVKKKVLERDS